MKSQFRLKGSTVPDKVDDVVILEGILLRVRVDARAVHHDRADRLRLPGDIQDQGEHFLFSAHGVLLGMWELYTDFRSGNSFKHDGHKGAQRKCGVRLDL